MRVRDDTTATKLLDSALMELNAGKSFDSVAAKYSEDPGSKDKGGVYDYFTSGRMVSEFNDFVFTGKPGDKKVVQTEYGFHYVEILGQKGSSMGYKIAYLSKPLEASAETINAASTAASQFAANSRSRKAFEANAKKQGKEVQVSPEIKANDFEVGPLGDNRQLVRWVFENKVGEVSEPFELTDVFVVAVITSAEEAGLQSAGKARPLVESIVRNEKKAQQILNTKFKGNSLEEVAKSSGFPVQKADSLSFQSPVIVSVGSEPKVVGAAFNKQVLGKMSPPIVGSSGVFAIKSEGVSAKPSLGGNAESLRDAVKNTLQQQNNQFISALRKAATVKDNRSTFY
jgi:peptidyl-prolyl cis-trans isomerase D